MRDKLLRLAERSTKIIEERDIQNYWQAQGFKFYNRPLMAWYEKEFNVEAEAIALQLPSIRKNLSDKHIDMNRNYDLDYLKKLRHDHYYMQLMFSGGYDSLTVFLEAVENGIYIDEIVMHLSSNSIDDEENREIKQNALPWAERYIQRYGKYSFIHHNTEMFNEVYKDPWALFKIPEFGTMPLTFRRIFLGYEKRRVTQNACYIKCSDKPQLLYYQGKWYVYALDANFGGSAHLPNIKYFWYEGDNIKSLIKSARLYRDYLVEQEGPPTENKFYKSYNLDNVIGRRPILNQNLQFKKQHADSFSDKDKAAMIQDLNNNQWTFLTDYFTCLKTFYDVFPEMRYQPFSKFNNKSKFFWFIDIDNLDVYTQKQLDLRM